MTRKKAYEMAMQALSQECVGSTQKHVGSALDMRCVKPQEPKTGHWTHDGSHWKNRFICSECGYKLFDEQTNFCPNCGAKMVEKQERSEQNG